MTDDSNLVAFPGITSVPFDCRTVSRLVDKRVAEGGVDRVFAVVVNEDGTHEFFSSDPNGQVLLYDLEMLKHRLMKIMNQE